VQKYSFLKNSQKSKNKIITLRVGFSGLVYFKDFNPNFANIYL